MSQGVWSLLGFVGQSLRFGGFVDSPPKFSKVCPHLSPLTHFGICSGAVPALWSRYLLGLTSPFTVRLTRFFCAYESVPSCALKREICNRRRGYFKGNNFVKPSTPHCLLVKLLHRLCYTRRQNNSLTPSKLSSAVHGHFNWNLLLLLSRRSQKSFYFTLKI